MLVAGITPLIYHIKNREPGCYQPWAAILHVAVLGLMIMAELTNWLRFQRTVL